jgi:UDP-GlcNAc:undecaprenyl-phosphate GlcNAc-1-phosphate transferase
MMLSLAAIAFLASVVDAAPLVLLCLILMGSILGFLNYNSHPARIFLGDAGSQFLGFSIATFAILLTEAYHTALNPALPFLLLGLPLVDTTWVFFLRVSQRKSPFRPDKQHLHHQLLAGGLTHGQSVSTIYLFQATLVATGLSVPYGSDATVMGLLLAECGGFLLLVMLLRRKEASTAARELVSHTQPAMRRWREAFASFRQTLTRVIEAALALFILTVSAVGHPFTHDIAALSLGLAIVVGFASVFIAQRARLFTRIGFYVAGALAVYGVEPLRRGTDALFWLPSLYLWALAILLIVAIVLTERERFQVSPQDLLVGFIALAAAALRNELLPGVEMAFLVIAGIALFYACEYVISAAEHRLLILRSATFVSLLLVGIRGLFL